MSRVLQLIAGLIALSVQMSCGGSDQDSHQQVAPPPNQEQRPPQPQSPDLKDDKNIIKDVNTIVKMVKMPLADFAGFRRSGTRPQKSMIVLVGENHVHERGLIDQVRVLRKLAKPGDIILLEGNVPLENGWQNCDSVIFRIYATKRWNERHSYYDPESHYALQKILTVPWKKNEDSFKIKSLNLNQWRCNFWDTHHAGQTSYTALRKRNQGLVAQIKKHMKSGRNIFVLAGYAHLPMGDLHEFKNYFLDRVPDAHRYFNLATERSISNLTPQSYYPRLRSGSQDGAQLREKHGFGSTEDVYDFLKNLNYTELIPRYLLARPDLCGEECD